MRYKREKEVDVESRVGGLKIERGYYTCAHCSESIFPLDEQLRLRDKHWSEGGCEAGGELQWNTVVGNLHLSSFEQFRVSCAYYGTL
jgi:hypothetical protein